MALIPAIVATWLLWAPDGDVLEAARKRRQAREREILNELVELLVLPNVASDRDGIRRNAEFLRARFEARGAAVQLLQAGAGNPAVYAELPGPPGAPTVMFYAHYDGQPVKPEEWESDPWQPVLRDGPLETATREAAPGDASVELDGDWRLYARSASDDKAPIVALLAALDGLRAAGGTPSVHLKFFLEGEEEAGSPSLRLLLQEHRELLDADLWILCDGPVHASGAAQVVFGARGIVGLELTVYGPTHALHSGHYGGWAPNPGMLLAHLLAGMRGPDGELRVPGVAEHVRALSAAERAALDAVPALDAALAEEYGIGWREGGGASLVECLQRPAMNLRGLASGATGAGAANAIPPRATASLDFRLVPDLTPERVRAAVEAHVRAQGFRVVHAEPDPATLRSGKVARLEWEEGYAAYRLPLDAPVSQALLRTVDSLGEPVVRMPGLGGSVPMSIFHEVLGKPCILLPIVNHDNHQHAANENLRLANLWRGIDLYTAVLAGLGDAWPRE